MLGIAVSIALVLGVAIGLAQRVDPLALGISAALVFGGVALGWRLARWRTLGLLLLAFHGGALRSVLVPQVGTDTLTPYTGEEVRLYGQILSAPEIRGGLATVRLRVSTLQRAIDPRPLDLDFTWPITELTGVAAQFRGVETGDFTEVNGRLQTPTSTAAFPRAEILRRSGVLTTLSNARVASVSSNGPGIGLLAVSTRTGIAEGFRRFLPEPHASLAAGMLVGGAGRLSTPFRTELQTTGLTHFVAIDGFKMALIGGAAGAIARAWFGRWRAIPITMIVMLLYVLLAGAPASAIRAALMAAAALMAGAIGRVADPLTTVCLVAAGMAFWEPPILGDVGFQLSFSATIGLILLTPRFAVIFRKLPRSIAETISVSLAASVSTLPVMMAQFQQASLVSPLAHVLATPLVAPIVGVSTALVGSLGMPAIATLLAVLDFGLLAVFIEITHVFSRLPGAEIFTGRLPMELALLLALPLVVWGTWVLPEFRLLRDLVAGAVRPLLVPRWTWLGLCVPMLAMLLIASRPDGRLHVSLLASGRGQAWFLRTPAGATVLILVSPTDARGLATLIGDHLHPWERGLSTVVAVNRDRLFGATEVLRRYPTHQQMVTGDDSTTLRIDSDADVWLDVIPGRGGQPSITLRHGSVVVAQGTPDSDLVAPGDSLVQVGDTPPLAGITPLITVGARQSTGVWLSLPAPRESALDFESDGISIWPKRIPTGSLDPEN